MSEPFLSEIRMMSFNFPPKGWALCDGQLLPINQNQALFSLLGTTFGGNGQTNFALPDLRARTPTHAGSGLQLGQNGGENSHTLTGPEMPTHTHQAFGSSDNANTPAPAGAALASALNVYRPPDNPVSLHPSSITTLGGAAHENRQPFLVVSFCIALQGIFPSRN